MSDIATLGIKIDSSQAATAAKTLDGLTNAAKPAAAAASNLEKAAKGTASAHAGLSTQAMAAQHSIRSLVEAMASGQPITQALGQQMNHLSYAATGPGGLVGAFKSAAGSLLGLISPAALVVGGLAAVGVAGVLAINNIAKTEKALDDTARAIGTTVQALHGLDAAAAVKGIDTDELLKGMQKFGASVYDAKNNMGGLAETFRANGASAKTFDDYLEKAADLIKNAGSDQQRLQMLQQMGLPATMQWVQLLSQGGQGLRDAGAALNKFGDTADAQLIAKARAFDEAWNKATTNLSKNLRNIAIEGEGWLDSLSNGATRLLMKIPGIGQNVPTNILRNAMNDRASGLDVGSRLSAASDVSSFYKGTGAGLGAATGPSVDPKARQAEIQRQQPLITLLGQIPSASQAAQPSKPVEKENDRDHRRLPKAA